MTDYVERQVSPMPDRDFVAEARVALGPDATKFDVGMEAVRRAAAETFNMPLDEVQVIVHPDGPCPCSDVDHTAGYHTLRGVDT